MLSERDNENCAGQSGIYSFAVQSNIGDRGDQQDSFGYLLSKNSMIITVCDGMGGYQGGKQASRLAVKTILERYEQQTTAEEPIRFLQKTTKEADRAIASIRNDDGSPFVGGTTMVTVLLSKNYLYWNSVGDSRIYLFRSEKEHIQLTQDHNYRTVLDEQRRTGAISDAEYQEKKKKANALINYVGIGDLELIDYNMAPFVLRENDRLLLTTDGLYKILDDQEISEIILNYTDTSDALTALQLKLNRRAKMQRLSKDNITMALIHISNRGNE